MEMALAASPVGNAVFAAGAPTNAPTSGYAPTYFPGTTSGSDAQKVVIAVGQEAQGTDFALLPVRLAKISGTVVGTDGKPSEGTMDNATRRVTENAGIIIPATARTDRNGNFTLNSLAPGDYTLQTRAMQIMTTGGGDTMTFTARVTIGAPDGGESEFGAMPVSVAGEDLNGVVIVTTKGTTATGHVTFEGGSKPATTSPIRVTASSVDGDAPSMGGGAAATVKDDGTFELKGLAGARIIRAGNLPNGWRVKSVQVNGQDITDAGM